MAYTVTVVPGITLVNGVAYTVDELNMLGRPTVTIVGEGAPAEASITFDSLNPNLITSGDALVGSLSAGDKVLIGVAASSTNAVLTVAELMKGVHTFATSATTFTGYTADTFSVMQGGVLYKMTPALVAEQLVAQAPSLSSLDAADTVLVHDASATDGSRAAAVTLETLAEWARDVNADGGSVTASGGVVSIDLSAGKYFAVDMASTSGTVNLTLSGTPAKWQEVVLLVNCNNATSTLTASTVKWKAKESGLANKPVACVTGRWDKITLLYDGTDWYGEYHKDYAI